MTTYRAIRPTRHQCPNCGAQVLAVVIISEHGNGNPTEHAAGGYMCSDEHCGWEAESVYFERG
jgi:predicted RNA-binding Zn-ribbon protein involved in translation (DUF1610 family)